MRTRKITDDYIVVEREVSPSDLIDRIIARAYRNKRRGGPPKPRVLKSRSREREFERRKKIRLSRRRNKKCTNCGGDGLTDGFKMCLDCRLRWRAYNARCVARKIFRLTPYGVGIDPD